MKRAAAVIFITLLLLVSGIIEIFIVKDVMIELKNSILFIEQKIIQNENNITVLEADMTSLTSDWEKKEVYLCLMFNHKDLSIITDSLNRLQTCTKLNNYDDAMVELMLLKLYSQNRMHLMGFNVQNIL